MASALTLISEVTTSGSQASVSFTSISASYRDLEVRIRGRGTTVANTVNLGLQYNNDTAGNYDDELGRGNGSSQSAVNNLSGTSAICGQLAAASATANFADLAVIKVGDYRGTTFQKAAISQNGTRYAGANTNLYTDVRSQWWLSTSAITRLDVFPTAGAFVDGSIVSLYGML